jgi:alginate O-acetyltransferase complex protein AlgI
MVFASLNFLFFFLAINLILYYLIKNKTFRNVLLTIMSLVFYAWGEPIWIGLLVFSSFVDYIHGLLIEKYRGTPWAKAPLISCIIINLSILATFKYAGFITDNVNFLTGLKLSVPTYSLPIGISFYTFQTISYVIDVYKQEVKAQRSFMKFLLFVSLFHQLVAGPIVRYSHIANEIDNRKIRINDISAGISRFCIGLFKKICIANVAGEMVVTYMGGDLSTLAFSEAWFGIVMFTIQIYFDFSGYSDMAIGMGRMVGFHYHENFNYPYTSKSASDFWRRWHISLGTFFRDYIYIPLGGNKKRFYLNVFVVWMLTGLWHGASWNFILWGLFWGTLILLERLFLQKVFNKLPAIVSHIYLLLAAMIGWVLFYFVDMSSVLHYLSILFGQSGNKWNSLEFNSVFMANSYWLILAIILCLPVYPYTKHILRNSSLRVQSIVPYATIVFDFCLLFLSTAMLVGKTFNPFLYFRF